MLDIIRTDDLIKPRREADGFNPLLELQTCPRGDNATRTAGFSELDKQRVFDIRFYPIILFFYGVITLKDKYYMAFPDKIMRNILLA